MLALKSWPQPCAGSRATPLYVDIVNGRAECPECRREFAICRDGTVRFHRLRA